MATIIVEDGSIVANANSYISEAYLTTYASDRGITLTQDTDSLIIQAMDYIESLNFIGYKLTEDQPLQWPRGSAVIDGYAVDTDEIPKELQQGLAETCIAIDQGNGPLDAVERSTKKEKVGEIEVEYMDNSSSTTIVKTINSKLRKLIAGGNNGLSFTVRRC